MNYRHAFHAGNFADVLKHAVLCRVLMHLRAKENAFRVVETHAGAGFYDLTGEEASRSGEWREGIGRLLTARLPAEASALLTPYLEAVAAVDPGASPTRYPGSPLLTQTLLRDQDRLVANEIEPGAAQSLARALGRDRRCKVVTLDGWTALRAQLPPPERRGLVLIDPPFEQPNEFSRLRDELAAAHRKWPSGIFLVWYPVKDRTGPDLLAKGLRREGMAKLLRAELAVGGVAEPQRLRRCGLIVINTPWLLEAELSTLLPALAEALSAGRPGAYLVDRLVAPI
jgi:23S rRNA (adenine2030-N6)-methyltransferase